MKCSVIVPVYNTEEYLSRCVESIIDQSYSSWECILVDDGSTDSSGFLCDELAKRDARIRVIHQRNAGVSRARNSGLDAASGSWIIFIDADDWLEREALETAVSAAYEHDAQIVQWNYRYIGNRVKQTEEIIDGELCIDSDTTIPLWFGMVWSKMYSRAMLERYSIRFPEGIAIGEDVAFSIEALAVASKIWCVKNRLTNYFQNAASASSNVSEERLLKNVEAVKSLIQFLGDRNLDSKMHGIILQLKRQVKDNFIFWLKPMNCDLYRETFPEVEEYSLHNGGKRKFAYKLLSKKRDLCLRLIVGGARLINVH